MWCDDVVMGGDGESNVREGGEHTQWDNKMKERTTLYGLTLTPLFTKSLLSSCAALRMEGGGEGG